MQQGRQDMLSIMSDTRQAGLQQRGHCVVAKSDVSVLVLGRFRRRRCHVQGKRSVCCPASALWLYVRTSMVKAARRCLHSRHCLLLGALGASCRWLCDTRRSLKAPRCQWERLLSMACNQTFLHCLFVLAAVQPCATFARATIF